MWLIFSRLLGEVPFHICFTLQGQTKTLKTGCPMGNHLKIFVAHIQIKVALRYIMNENLYKMLHAGHITDVM